MDFDALGFPTNYRVRLLDSTPALTPDYHFAVSRTRVNGEQLSFDTQLRGEYSRVLEVVTSEGKVWTGRFEAGPEGINGLFAAPSPNTLIVVVQGQGYWIPTLYPVTYEVVRAIPIKQVWRVPERDIVLFIDFVRISAYGPDGFLWRTKDLSWDGLIITEVTAWSVLGLGWDSPDDRHVEFSIDISTGMTTGGSSPGQYSTTK